MKKIKIFVWLLLPLLNIASLQAQGPSAGISLGTNVFFPSDVVAALYERETPQLGGDLGAFLGIPLSNSLGLEIIGTYQLRRFTLYSNWGGIFAPYREYHISQHLNVPVFLNLHLSPTFKVGLGPNIDYLFSHFVDKAFIINGVEQPSSEYDDTARYHKMGLGGNLQLAMVSPIGLGLYVRSSVSLLDPLRATRGLPTPGYSKHNITLMAGITYQLFGRNR